MKEINDKLYAQLKELGIINEVELSKEERITKSKVLEFG